MKISQSFLSSTRTFHILPFFYAVALTIIAIGAVQSEEIPRQNGGLVPAVECMLVDSDSNLDDLRALAVLASGKKITVVVTTEGILPAHKGAETLARFLSPLQRAPIIIEGLSARSSPPHWKWFDETRAEAEHLNDKLQKAESMSLPISKPNDVAELARMVQESLAECQNIGVLMIGPWTSFTAHYDSIRARVRFIVAQGQPPNDPVDPTWDGVNCDFDSMSCSHALDQTQGSSLRWVNLARNTPYPLSTAMIARLEYSPLALALKAVMQVDPSWHHQQLWDDAAAIFIEKPNAFRQVGGHFEPSVTVSQLQDLELELVNRKKNQ